MPERLRQIFDYLPFAALMSGPAPRQTPLIAKLLEAAVMSCVAGGFATYIGVELLKVEITNIKAAIHDVEKKVETIDSKIEKVRGDLYVPRGSQ